MKKVLLLVAEGFETFEASVFIDVIGWNLTEGDGSTQLFSCGFKKEVKTSFNQAFLVDYTIDQVNVNDFDALAIPGGFEEYNFYHEGYNEKLLALIREFNHQQKVIASICVGALLVGKSGILVNRNATTYNSPARREALRSFGANVMDQPIVVDGNVITSWNPSTAVDVALLLLEKLTSDINAGHIRKIMGFEKK